MMPERYVAADCLRIGDVAEHPASHQWGQVVELREWFEHVDVRIVGGCRWRFRSAELLRVHHRVVDIEA